MPTMNLPAGVQVFARGWLSSNNILMQGASQTALVDSGYCLHSAQTLALVRAALPARAPDLLVNTHLHSDHCGGNAALQAAFPQMQTAVPQADFDQVLRWDVAALGYDEIGQLCPRFTAQQRLCAGSDVRLGDADWQVLPAPGHDPHAVLLFEPCSATLISGDALWERGFGVVFPDGHGNACFDDVARTLDRIEALRPAYVIPGHGAPFTDVAQALKTARERLDAFVSDPGKHRRHAVKVLIKFKLMQDQQMERGTLLKWVEAAPHLCDLMGEYAAPAELPRALDNVLAELVRAGVLRVDACWVYNA